MLVLTRRYSERILIGDDIEVIVCSIKPGQVQLGITAPKDVKILRPELVRYNEGRNAEVQD
jgi:carbon storage regulator